MTVALPPNPQVVARIALVWRALAHAYVDSDVQREMLKALQRRDVNGALNALPNMNDPRDVFAQEMKARLMRVLVGEQKTAFKLSADREYERVGSDLRVAKADKEPALNRFAEVLHDDEFIFNRAAELVVDIGDEQRDNLRQTLAMRFDPDVRPENVIRDIKWVVGLTDRESAAVFRREDKMREAGVPEQRIQSATQRYSDELHQKRAERIARTETVAIETQARDTAWKIARSDGLVPDGAKKLWVASYSACAYCRALVKLGKIPLDGTWAHPEDGRIITGPPAHPHCECSTVLRAA